MSTKKTSSIFFISLIITIVFAGCGIDSIGPNNISTGSASLAWDAPTTYVDGTPATGPAGYKVYYGTASRTYTHIIDVKTAQSCTINSLAHSTYYFAITAYDTSGIESDYSDEISKTIF